MKRSAILLFVLMILGFVQHVYAQDTIYKANSDIVVAKVLEVGNYDIRYTRYHSPDGPVYTLRKAEVWKVVYADGTVEYYNRHAKPYDQALPPEIQQRRFFLGLNVVDLAFGMLSLTAEYNVPKSNVTLRLPISSGLRPLLGMEGARSNIDKYYYNQYKRYSLSPQLLYFPYGHSRVNNFYVGLITEFGQTVQREYIYNYPNAYYRSAIVNFGGFGTVMGYQIQMGDRISVGADASLGMLIVSNDELGSLFRLGVHMGYRFGSINEEPKAK